MTARTLKILLALSAILNVGFVAGFLVAGHTVAILSTPQGKSRWAADHLDLTAEQRQSYDRLSGEWFATVESAEQGMQTRQRAFWQEMTRDGSDLVEARRRFDPLIEHQKALMVEGLGHLHRIFAILQPTQREELARMLAPRR
jgi:Spy/CpxP family protein refolding chaperone